MTPHEFVHRWQAADLSERAACQSHFADLCAVLGQPKPTDVDPTGAWYAFEKGVDTSEGKKGWADIQLNGVQRTVAGIWDSCELVQAGFRRPQMVHSS